jgi:hypothetical protein
MKISTIYQGTRIVNELFALLIFIIPPIMGGQDSNLNFKLLSSLIKPYIEAEPSFL